MNTLEVYFVKWLELIVPALCLKMCAVNQVEVQVNLVIVLLKKNVITFE